MYVIHNYTPMERPESITLVNDELHINNEVVVIKYLNIFGEQSKSIRVECSTEDLRNIIRACDIVTSGKEFPLTVREFEYNGFHGKANKNLTEYTATFLRWTNDPGIGVFSCSDGKERLIPEFALIKWAALFLPQQDYGGKLPQAFGVPAHS